MTRPVTAASEPLAREAPVFIEVAGLTKRYGEQQALANVSFDIRCGEILGLIGPNGSGKTTLLETMAGVLPVDHGDVLWRGTAVSLAHRRDLIFYLPDGLRPWDDQYVERVLEFFAAVYGRSKGDARETVRSVGLAPVLGKRVSALSKGFSRRLMLALAFMTPHPLLLMDEPFDGFDLKQTRDIMGIIRRVAANGRTLVLAIHQLTDAERICDRFVLLASGTVRGIGTLADLRVRTDLASAGLEEVFLALT